MEGYSETLTAHRVLSFRGSGQCIYNWFYFVPRLKNLREVMKAEYYLLSLVVKAFSNLNSFFFFFFACTKKKQKSAPGNDKQPIAGKCADQLLYKVVKDFWP